MTTSSPKKEYKPLLAQLTDQEGEELCAQLRRELVEDVSSTGGHLASNLGAVELTVALHRVFDTSVDRLVFDVGHQCYTHKMLTGRREAMSTLRQYGGVAGFPTLSTTPLSPATPPTRWRWPLEWRGPGPCWGRATE